MYKYDKIWGVATMRFLDWVYRKIPFMNNERRRLKRTVKAVAEVKEMLLPMSMIDFDDVLSSLYDLIIDLPEGFQENIREFKKYDARMYTTSTVNLYKVLQAGLENNFTLIGNDGRMIKGQPTLIRFLEWYSNMTVFEEITEELKAILPKAILHHRSFNKDLPIDTVNMGVDISDKEIVFVTHRYFKYVLLDYLELLTILTDIRIGGRVE